MKTLLVKIIANFAMALPILVFIVLVIGTALDFIALNLAQEIYVNNPLILVSRNFWALLGY